MKKRPAYNPGPIEKKWQKKWASSKIYRSIEKAGKDKAYILDMFPYPSGEGLHVGHPKGYIATDVVSRMKRMQGMNVLHPMGFDAFGLPAENYAIKTKTNPADAVAKNVKRFKKQLEILGLDYDWSREINTTDPEYYRWTQWIFLQMWKRGLAFESNEPINWCPSCKTGLANEDVENGRCERCGTLVEKKPMRQWVLKITDYADRLLADLDAVDIPRFTHRTGTDAWRADMPVVERHVTYCIIKHWSEDSYLCMKWKKNDWKGYVIGGIEDGESIEDTAVREVREETGYQNVAFRRLLGRTQSCFYQEIKKQNRLAHGNIVFLELLDGTQTPITDEEKAIQDMEWVPRSQVRDFVNREDLKYMWDLYTGAVKQDKLLDWPEPIKESQRNWIGRSEGAHIDFRLKPSERKIRFVILHGFEGSAKTNFIPWLKKTLEARGYEVEAPELPNTNDPKESEQVDYVLKNCKLDDNTVVIGHSLGAIVAMKVIMKSGKKISGLTLVAPATDPAFYFGKEDSRKYKNSFSWSLDYSLIKRLTDERIAVLSDLQEEKRRPYLKHLAKELSAAFIETKATEEHFCALEEPEILRSVTPSVRVFTTRADTIYGVTYLVLAPEHPWVEELLSHVGNKAEVSAYIDRAKKETDIERTDATKEKTGVELQGIKAVNPANGEEVPVWIADYVLADYGTGAVMAVPAHDERDAEFARVYKLPVKEIKLENKLEMTAKFGEKVTKYKLRDWVFSRQRYWGEPIPLIHCPKCGVVAVPEKDLPVKLPKVKSYEPTGTGESPLAAIDKWVNVKCPQCRGKAKRETNTMPQWAGSSWYYLRYQDTKNKKALVDLKKEKYWSPVDLYVGGAEHATRHLIYARFWHKFLYDIGAVSTIEPFKKLQNVGLIMGEDGRKMSKRFGNVVNPDDIVNTYGADTLRVYEMFMGPFDQQISWNTESMVGPRRFIERVWKMAERVDHKSAIGPIDKSLHKAIKKVSDDISLLRFNTAISTLMITLNDLEKAQTVSRGSFEAYLKLLAPFAPHVTDELWHKLGNRKSIHISEWPKYDPAMLVDDTVTIVVQINGKVRANLEVSRSMSSADVENMAKNEPNIVKWLEGKPIKKTVVVPGRLINIVV